MLIGNKVELPAFVLAWRRILSEGRIPDLTRTSAKKTKYSVRSPSIQNNLDGRIRHLQLASMHACQEIRADEYPLEIIVS